MELILSDVEFNLNKSKNISYAKLDTAFNLSRSYREVFGNRKVGAIIFSPPYANSFDYFESYKLELVMGRFVKSIKDIKKYRNMAVRSFVNNSKEKIVEDYYIDLLAKEIEQVIPIKEAKTKRKDHRTRKVPKMIRSYFSDMEKIIAQCSEILEKDRRIYIVVDQSSYLGKIIPTDILLGYIAE